MLIAKFRRVAAVTMFCGAVPALGAETAIQNSSNVPNPWQMVPVGGTGNAAWKINTQTGETYFCVSTTVGARCFATPNIQPEISK